MLDSVGVCWSFCFLGKEGREHGCAVKLPVERYLFLFFCAPSQFPGDGSFILPSEYLLNITSMLPVLRKDATGC